MYGRIKIRNADVLAGVIWGVLIIWAALAVASAARAQRRPPEMDTWVQGTVRDEAGKPIAGAKVFARATYHGAIRFYGLLHTATTGADGRYKIVGEANSASFTATLVAYLPNHPPAFGRLVPEFESSGPVSQDAVTRFSLEDMDLVIADSGGKLEVLVTRDGQPVSDASIAVRLEGSDPFDHWGLEHKTDEHLELLSICRPAARTGPDGIARLDLLPTGLYSVFAAPGDEAAVRPLTEYGHWYPFGDEPVCGEAIGVPVRRGETTAHRLAMFRHGCTMKVEVLRNGKV